MTLHVLFITSLYKIVILLCVYHSHFHIMGSIKNLIAWTSDCRFATITPENINSEFQKTTASERQHIAQRDNLNSKKDIFQKNK